MLNLFQHLPTYNICIIKHIYSIIIALWIIRAKGVSKFDGNKWINYTKGNSELLDDHVDVIYVDSNGFIFMQDNDPNYISKLLEGCY